MYSSTKTGSKQLIKMLNVVKVILGEISYPRAIILEQFSPSAIASG